MASMEAAKEEWMKFTRSNFTRKFANIVLRCKIFGEYA